MNIQFSLNNLNSIVEDSFIDVASNMENSLGSIEDEKSKYI